MTLPERKRLRLKEFDYASARAYFVTICLQGRYRGLAEILPDEHRLTELGLMVEARLNQLGHKFTKARVREYVIMPDHIHAIIEIREEAAGTLVGADQAEGRSVGPQTNLPSIIQWFKAITTRDFGKGIRNRGWVPFADKFWQRGYHDHIIRNDTSFENIILYIQNNPVRWLQETDPPD